jgi:hypothetical protein
VLGGAARARRPQAWRASKFELDDFSVGPGVLPLAHSRPTKEECSFLQKRTKKLLPVRAAPVHHVWAGAMSKGFCFFFSKRRVLPSRYQT